MPDVRYVTAGRPKTGGAVHRAPAGTTAPTDAATALGEAFVDQGYVSDSGIVNNNSPSSESVKAWGGDTVLDLQTEKPDTWALTLISAKDVAVLKTVYGEDNVTGTLETGITVTANAKELPSSVWVIDQVLRGGTLKRTVLPDAKITEIGEITYSDSAAVGYPLTLSAYPDASGNTHYEYIINP